MLITALILFALSAVGGLYLATMHFRGTPPPIALAVGHGVVALSGLACLVAAVLAAPTASRMPLLLGLFVLVAVMGFLLLSFHLMRRPLPKLGIVFHAGFAILGVVLLLVAALR